MKKVKDLVVISMMACILFVQEQILTPIPNVQLTFLLIICYQEVFGIKKSILIILIHVILDNLVMGSFNVIVILPMFLGYLLTIMFKSFYKGNNIYMIGLIGILSSIIYALGFALFNVLFLEIKIVDYLIADIPFTLILCLSTFLSILWLYNPITKILRKKIEE